MNRDNDTERLKAQRYVLPKDIIKTYDIIINGKNFYDRPIDSDLKRYKEIRKLTTREGEDCTAGWLLDYDYSKNHIRLIAVDLSRQKELHTDPKAIQYVTLVEKLNKK